MNAKDLGEAILAMNVSTTIAKTRTFDVPLSDFPLEAIQAFIAYGFQRKFNDAVGGATRNDEPYTPALKVADAEALIADYKAGKLSKRREGGGGVTDETSAGRKVMRAMLPALLSDVDLKAFRALEAADANVKLDAWVDANAADLAPAIADELAAMRAQKERRDGLKGIAIKL